MSDDSNDEKKSRLESVIPGLLKRAVERGVERAVEAPHDLKEFVTDLKLPKEIAGYIFSQVDETKNGLFRVVGNEVRDFLEHTNFAGEMQKILTTVQFEINTTIRFRPNEPNDKPREDESDPNAAAAAGEGEKMGRPEVKTNVHVRREERREERRRRRERRDRGSGSGSGGGSGESGGGEGSSEG
jgi:hypothetical protein